jgi:hypothetical protein
MDGIFRIVDLIIQMFRFSDRRSSRIDQKSDRMVYLSNLPWELKWMELKDIIREKAGEVLFSQ